MAARCCRKNVACAILYGFVASGLPGDALLQWWTWFSHPEPVQGVAGQAVCGAGLSDASGALIRACFSDTACAGSTPAALVMAGICDATWKAHCFLISLPSTRRTVGARYAARPALHA